MGGLFAETALAAIEFPAALRCVSPYAVTAQGTRRLEALHPSTDLTTITGELARVDAVRRRLDAGDDIAPVPPGAAESALDRLGIDGAVLEGPELIVLLRLMEAGRLTGQKVRRAGKIEPLLAPLEAAPPPAELEREVERALDPDGRVKDAASRDLERIRRELVAAREDLVRTLERILASVDARHRGEGAGVTLRAGRYVLPVRREGRARIGGIVHDESATHATLFVEPPEAIELNNRLRSLEAEEAREVQRILRELTAALRPHAALLADALEMIVALDSYYGRARYAQVHDAAVPAVGPAGSLFALRAAAHPLLFKPDAAVVRFDFVLEAGERTVIVSGPNTGGKTVLLKGVGLAVALVQSGILPPLGAGSAVPVCDALFTDIGDRQSIQESLSTFSAHVAHLRTMLAEAGPGSLVLVDELGTGTDPAEGSALAAAALVALTRRGATTIATTHLGALKDLAESVPGVVNASLQFDAATLAPTYRYVKGVPGRSYGLAIARRLGVEPAVLADAESRVSAAERRLDAMLAAAEARGQALDRALGALQARELEVANLEARTARDRAALEAREDALRQTERSLDRKGRSGMRDYLLEARAEVERALVAAREGREKEARRALEVQIAALAGGDRAGEGPDAVPHVEEADEGPGRVALVPGTRVRIRSLGLEGEIETVQGDDVAVRVRGRRVRVKAADLR